jgi:hypothetical protein
MADLSAAARKRIPKKQFGLPSKAENKGEKAESGNYPMPDKSHARNAKARASQEVKKGNLSSGQKAKIDAKANKVLGKSKSK